LGYFKKIIFNNFRNFSYFSIDFDSACNIIVGKNGSGKTNILEGLSLFEKGKGFKKEKISNLINFENKNKNFNISSIFNNKDISLDVNIYNSEKNLKKILVNNSEEKESINHFESLFSIIYFLPEMERLFLAPPSLRRNFLDRLIFNHNKNYNKIVNNYKKAINERQVLLKDNLYDEIWIENLEKNIAEFAYQIYEKRNSQIDIINKILQEMNLLTHFSHKFLLQIKDDFLDNNLEAIYDKEIFVSHLKNNRKIDFLSGGCSIGPHRSDFLGFNLENNFNLSQLSTGQQKTVILLIIIAQCKYLIDQLKFSPIILLDEVCSHLDSKNRELLLYLVDELNIQIFMTGTENNFFSFLSTKANYCNIT